ncbi:hypothetical protein EIP91_009088 [Steccherinum ochraceum]|uniref:Uncharacterized protein n=1 Tax=Steccherinum ochraceum TaxID=92696 RepID=A0A4R0RRW5_9APHY|nr:hypothetical protein EIP91_009088 [Steccherinum ochraceum]
MRLVTAFATLSAALVTAALAAPIRAPGPSVNALVDSPSLSLRDAIETLNGLEKRVDEDEETSKERKARLRKERTQENKKLMALDPETIEDETRKAEVKAQQKKIQAQKDKQKTYQAEWDADRMARVKAAEAANPNDAKTDEEKAKIQEAKDFAQKFRAQRTTPKPSTAEKSGPPAPPAPHPEAHGSPSHPQAPHPQTPPPRLPSGSPPARTPTAGGPAADAPNEEWAKHLAPLKSA